MAQKMANLAVRDSTGAGGMDGVREAMARGSMMSEGMHAGNSYRASRGELEKHIPEEYADALLDDDYMERLVLATNKLNKQRRKAMDRYFQMNMAIFYVLIVQAVLGVLIAIYKTLLMPTNNYSVEANLEDVDMVLMLDASNHIGENWEGQHQSVTSFTKFLFERMKQVVEDKETKAKAYIAEEKEKNAPWLARLLNIDTGGDETVNQHGGRLRIATGLFNSKTTFASSFTHKTEDQVAYLEKHHQDSYVAHAMWHSAMSQCEKVIADQSQNDEDEYRKVRKKDRYTKRCHEYKPNKKKGEKPCDEYTSEECPGKYCDVADKKCKKKKPLCRKQYCVIIGDSDALCNKRGGTEEEDERPPWEDKIERVCGNLEGNGISSLCPSKEDRAKYGNPLEWANEMEDCKVKADNMNSVKEFKRARALDGEHLDDEQLNGETGTELIMMFTVPTDAERQMRLANTRFRDFIKATMDCVISRRPKEITSGGVTSTYDEYFVNNTGPQGCLRFMMETSLDAVMNKAENVARLLESQTNKDSQPNSRRDPRFLFFLVLPLNLLFYLGWTKLVQMYSAAETAAKRAVGAKKKMIKVTKTLVEKDPEPLPQMLPEFQELELAEIQKMRQPVEFGIPLTLRARLKGGYIHDNRRDRIADGHGHAFDQQSTWTFQAVGSSADLSEERRFRIQNMKGQYLKIDEDGATVVDDPDRGGCTEFSLVPHNDEDEEVNMGDMGHIKCAGTGKFMRVHKDGRIDGLGEKNQPETQVVVDAGGVPVASGSIITLQNATMGEYVHAGPGGEVRVGNDDATSYHSDDWKYWLIEKKQAPLDRMDAIEPIESEDGGGGGGLMAPAPAMEKTLSSQSDAHEKEKGQDWLHEGDIVTLKAFNQNMLEVDSGGNVICGDVRPGGGSAVGEGLAASSSAGAPSQPASFAGAPSQPASFAGSELTQEFLVHRVGVSTVTKHNNTIRRGAQICLKPVMESLPASCYLRAEEDGSGLAANGHLIDRDISFTIEVASIQNVVTPLSPALQKGDADIAVTPLWNKNEVKHVEALSAAYTTDESLRRIKGAIVVAAPSGAYSVPRGGDAWVGVVNDGVDLFKAARQAKQHGATGLVVRCENACSLDRLALGSDGVNAPELPIVFVNEACADSLNERGLMLKGCDIRKKYITDVMRAIGRAGAPQTRGHQANKEVFTTAGRAMLEWQKEWEKHKAAEEEREAIEAEMWERQQQEDSSAQSGYNWKVNANTHYLWATGGGGATKMKVDYGKKAPPSITKVKFNKKTGQRASVDAGYGIAATATINVKRTRLSVTAIPAEDVRDLRLGQELEEVLTVENPDELAQEELSEESDFRIEYKFQEIEVGIDEQAEDVEEEEIFNDEGAVIAAVGVPKKKFWIVAAALGVSTVALTIFLLAIFLEKDSDAEDDSDELEVEKSVAKSFLQPVASSLAGVLSKK